MGYDLFINSNTISSLHKKKYNNNIRFDYTCQLTMISARKFSTKLPVNATALPLQSLPLPVSRTASLHHPPTPPHRRFTPTPRAT